MRIPFTGAGTALVTPFTRSGALDEAAVRRLGRRQIDAGIHFLTPCGTTGENPTLTPSERIRIVEILADESAGARYRSSPARADTTPGKSSSSRAS